MEKLFGKFFVKGILEDNFGKHQVMFVPKIRKHLLVKFRKKKMSEELAWRIRRHLAEEISKGNLLVEFLDDFLIEFLKINHSHSWRNYGKIPGWFSGKIFEWIILNMYSLFRGKSEMIPGALSKIILKKYCENFLEEFVEEILKELLNYWEIFWRNSLRIIEGIFESFVGIDWNISIEIPQALILGKLLKITR